MPFPVRQARINISQNSNTMQAVVIAAGESSRFWPLNLGHKSQFYLLGKPLLYWTLKGAQENGIKNAVVVCGPNSSIPSMLEKEKDFDMSLSYVVQEKPLGTGNALWQAHDLITEPFFVLWPNKVNTRELVAKMKAVQEEQKAEVVLVGAATSTPWSYGVARLDGKRVTEIVEKPEPGAEPSNVKVIGSYFFQPDFFSYYEKLKNHHEIDLIDAINLYLKDKKASLVELQEDVPTLKYPWELFETLDILFHTQKVERSIAPSAVIGEGTVIEGPVYIGEDCNIGAHNVLRGPLNLERGVKTGAFCELKHSIVQEGTHFHSGYIGDSVVGKNCRFGAGFVTANRRLDRTTIKATVKGKKTDTGLTYLGVVVGNGTQCGIHAGTMPGVCIGSQCVIGPGTLVFENLPDNSTLYAKQEYMQKQREG